MSEIKNKLEKELESLIRNKCASGYLEIRTEELKDIINAWNTRAEPDYKAKCEELEFALSVEEHDNEYNCAEKDKLKAENARLRAVLQGIANNCSNAPIYS